MARPNLSRLIGKMTEFNGRKERDLFTGAQDVDLKRITGTFPAVIKTSHPIFVLSANATGAQVCPCTRDPYPRASYRYIRKGCLRSGPHGYPIDNTYLLEDCSFPLPHDRDFIDQLHFEGNVPEDAIEGVFRGEGRLR